MVLQKLFLIEIEKQNHNTFEDIFFFFKLCRFVYQGTEKVLNKVILINSSACNIFIY